MNLLIIFNPKAAFGRSVSKMSAISSHFKRAGLKADFIPTEHAGHGSELVANTDLSGYDGVVAAGGDGTVFEVLNGLYRLQKSARIPLGLLPIGTGNAFARDLGLAPAAWQDAIELLRHGHTRWVDVGHVQSAGDDYYFLNILGTGFTVDAGQTAKKLKFIGNAAYTVATLWRALTMQSYPLVIELDGRELQQENIFVTISNTRYTGTHFLIAPDAVIDDGLLDVVLLEALPRHRLLKLFPTIYDGRHVEHKEISTHRVSSVFIRSPTDMLMAPDGEFRGKTPARISCLQQDLQIFCDK